MLPGGSCRIMDRKSNGRTAAVPSGREGHMDISRVLGKYADLAVNAGINLQQGEGLIIGTGPHGLPLAREAAKQAYAAGASHVELLFTDDEITLSRYLYGRDCIFDHYPKWKADALIAMYKDHYQHLFINAPNPDLLRNVSAERAARDRKTVSAATAAASEYRMTAKTRWTIVAVPSPEWAASVYPSLSADEGTDALWQNIIRAVRLDADDPSDAWRRHDENLKKHVDFLNAARFDSLIFRAPGTDLKVGLAEGHKWVGGSKNSTGGIAYFANMPTEEVFTTPHRLKVEGTLRATRPLSLNGRIVRDFRFTFRDGRVVDYDASEGKEAIGHLLANDEGACYLGEVALVPDDSPLSNMKILFNNTLFDENASVHFAFGQSYGYAMADGASKSKPELLQRGANTSLIHADFMAGCPELSVTALASDGRETVLFRNGNWAV